MYLSQLKNVCLSDFKSYFSQHAMELKEWLISQGVVSFSLFTYDRLLFLYLESQRPEYEFRWSQSYMEWLEWWPGEHELRMCVPLVDVFHDGLPVSLESWRGDRKIEKRVGSVARLKPDMFSSYVFYHHQKQVEQAESFNKTYLIGSFESYLFSYQELPAFIDEESAVGFNKTSNSPANWHEVMYPHFILWPDTSDKERLWRSMEKVFSY